MRSPPRARRGALVSVLLALLPCFLHAAEVNVAPDIISERGPHHRVWHREKFESRGDGSAIKRVSRIVDLASGLHYWENQQWNEAQRDRNRRRRRSGDSHRA
jgi:hypothetical protein